MEYEKEEEFIEGRLALSRRRLLLRLVEHLACLTMVSSAFHGLVGVGTTLYLFDTAEILELTDGFLQENSKKDEVSCRKVRKVVLEGIQSRFGSSIVIGLGAFGERRLAADSEVGGELRSALWASLVQAFDGLQSWTHRCRMHDGATLSVPAREGERKHIVLHPSCLDAARECLGLGSLEDCLVVPMLKTEAENADPPDPGACSEGELKPNEVERLWCDFEDRTEMLLCSVASGVRLRVPDGPAVEIYPAGQRKEVPVPSDAFYLDVLVCVEGNWDVLAGLVVLRDDFGGPVGFSPEAVSIPGMGVLAFRARNGGCVITRAMATPEGNGWREWGVEAWSRLLGWLGQSVRSIRSRLRLAVTAGVLAMIALLAGVRFLPTSERGFGQEDLRNLAIRELPSVGDLDRAATDPPIEWVIESDREFLVLLVYPASDDSYETYELRLTPMGAGRSVIVRGLEPDTLGGLSAVLHLESLANGEFQAQLVGLEGGSRKELESWRFRLRLLAGP